MPPKETRDSERAVIASLTLPGHERSAAHIGRFVRDTLGADHPAVDDVNTCVNEAFTNGVAHTASGRGGKITVTLAAAPGVLLAEVTDDGANGDRPHLRRPGVESGRGMHLINALTGGWGLHADGDRTTIWMRFPSAWSGARGFCRPPGP
ncbi:ATP-binding protein [Actinomadura barringtoniae]|uniref:ATP-binding protein n=1 Tax=Actinomadura barringtoniae TaxID=1427535 RepID=A0A939PHJ6_9ACTN|nr:ATP-binding protein [Actinomadura barringtoniae]MBO2452816.1 ATP-binding protein [Actinomadura barringtoniae]